MDFHNFFHSCGKLLGGPSREPQGGDCSTPDLGRQSENWPQCRSVQPHGGIAYLIVNEVTIYIEDRENLTT